MRGSHFLLVTLTVFSYSLVASADDKALNPAEASAVADVQQRADQIKAINRSLWELAEVGLQERKSSALLIGQLKEAGFTVKEGVADMPTAFVASYGSGRPIIGILAEYDALPGMSQKLSSRREAVTKGGAGHACGHSGLGAAAVGAALAVKASLEKHNISGTIRLYGTPAEETVIGKVYMTLDGQFNDLDACLHWHPSDRNEAWSGSSKALVAAKFTFAGTPSHASVSPESGRSALDAVELMNVGANFMREHLKEDARLHYVTIDGGGQPNVVPPTATVWYFVRADGHKDVEANFRWLQEVAEGAALMTQTKLSIVIDTDCHEIVVNAPLSDLTTNNLERIGAPSFDAKEIEFARRLQAPLTTQFGTRFPLAIDERIHHVTVGTKTSKGSTDVGDISWRVPTGGRRTSCLIAQSPGHSWQNVACIGSTIGEKGIIYAAKVLAVTAIDLYEDPKLLAAARGDWQQRMKSRTYFSFIPDGQAPPRKIR